MKRKIYLAHCFSQAPHDFLNIIQDVRRDLEKEYEILSCKISEGTSANDFYKESIKNCLPRCDIFVAFCDYPATGLGYELAVALEKYSKPTLGLAQEGIKITRMVQGIDHPMYTFKRFKTQEDIIFLIKEKESRHFKSVVPVEVCET